LLALAVQLGEDALQLGDRLGRHLGRLGPPLRMRAMVAAGSMRSSHSKTSCSVSAMAHSTSPNPVRRRSAIQDVVEPEPEHPEPDVLPCLLKMERREPARWIRDQTPRSVELEIDVVEERSDPDPGVVEVNRPNHCMDSHQEDAMDKDDMKKKADEAAEKTTDKAKAAGSAAESAGEKAKQALQQAAQTAGEKAKEAKESIGEKTKEAGEKVKEEGGEPR
jgi:hypothetical protein